MAECACARLIVTSFIDVPFLVCVDPKYFNWSTSTSFFSIHPYIDRWFWFDAADKFALLEPISMLHPAAVFSILSVSCWSSSSLPSSRSMSSANCKLQSSRHQLDTDDSGVSIYPAFSTASSAKQSLCDRWCGVKALCIIFSNNILNSTGEWR